MSIIKPSANIKISPSGSDTESQTICMGVGDKAEFIVKLAV